MALAKVEYMGWMGALSKARTRSAIVPNAADLEGFRRCQRLAYRCATEIGRELREGWTERRAAALMDQWLRDHGVSAFFHRSLAWFGEHTRFQGRPRWQALPSKRVLRASDVVILDTAPMLEGFVADIGYTFSLEPSVELEAARGFLRRLRDELPSFFASPTANGRIWRRVDAGIRASGFDNIHSLYPFSVLGHRVYRLPAAARFTGRIRIPATPFTVGTIGALATRGALTELLGPFHSGTKQGLWAIEPHIGGRGFGAKFEEILVVDGARAYWLDDQVPHVMPASASTARDTP